MPNEEKNHSDVKEKQKKESTQITKWKKIHGFYKLISGIVLIQIFVYLASPRSHPFEDYFFVLLTGTLIMAIGGIIHIAIKFVRHLFKNK